MIISPGPFESAMKMPPSLVVAVSAPILVSIGSASVPIALLVPVVVRLTPSPAVRLTAEPFASVIAPFVAVSIMNALPASRAPSGKLPATFSRVMFPFAVVAFNRVATSTSRGL